MDNMIEKSIAEFVDHGCNCSFGPNNTPCCKLFSIEHYLDMQSWCAGLTTSELDMVMMGQIMSLTDTSERTTSLKHKERKRQRIRATYLHKGKRVCKTTFLYLHDIKNDKFINIQRSCINNGLTPRVHGNTKRLPIRTLSFDDVTHVVTFIKNYAEDHAILLPGRMPGYKSSNVQLLPCSTTKHNVWLEYKAASELIPRHGVAYSTFCKLWRELLPMILPSRPRTDLCPVCHSKAGLLMRCSNLTEDKKTEANQLYL